MAKKKSHNHNHNGKTENDETLNHPPPPPMHQQPEQEPVLAMADQQPPLSLSRTSSLEGSENEKLKALNKRLIDTVADKRRQVEALEREKKTLESELEKRGADFVVGSDERACSEIERSIAFAALKEREVDVESLKKENLEQEGEIESLKEVIEKLTGDLESGRERLSRTCREKDIIEGELSGRVEEAEGLKAIVKEMEEKEKTSEGEILELKFEIERLSSQKEVVEEEVEFLKRVRDSAEMNLSVRVSEIEALKSEIERILDEKNAIETEKSDQIFKIGSLEEEIKGLNDSVASFTTENGLLSEKVIGLEMSYGDAIEKEKTLREDIDSLIEAQREKIKMVEVLTEEKDSLVKMIDSVNGELEGKKELIEKLSREKEEVEGISKRKESEIAELLNKVSELADSLIAAKDSIKTKEAINTELASECAQYRERLERVKVEKHDLQMALEDEQGYGANLRSKLAEVEARMEAAAVELEKSNSEKETVMEEKKAVEAEFESLKKLNGVIEKKLAETQVENGELEGKLKSSEMKLERALSLLSNTVELVSLGSNSNGSVGAKVEENKVEEQMEAIKSCFRDKDAKVEEMKQRVGALENSVAEAEKKKSFWAMVSSVTTVVAAASLAFAVKVR
ncbi:unnamed protein product [Linum trigynum]|uniref:Uncharacterized protein n=1 Tax=Linum trigynum TaxID=586398 RepID=A0AAV2CID2_9ROSI